MLQYFQHVILAFYQENKNSPKKQLGVTTGKTKNTEHKSVFLEQQKSGAYFKAL